jgi:hypothetical protein
MRFDTKQIIDLQQAFFMLDPQLAPLRLRHWSQALCSAIPFVDAVTHIGLHQLAWRIAIPVLHQKKQEIKFTAHGLFPSKNSSVPLLYQELVISNM